jgi:hypothetical protein
MNEPPESLFPEIREGLACLEMRLPRQIDAMAISPVSKLPFKAMLYRAALMWRMTELGRGALEHFEDDKLASAIQLTRAAVETSAAL